MESSLRIARFCFVCIAAIMLAITLLSCKDGGGRLVITQPSDLVKTNATAVSLGDDKPIVLDYDHGSGATPQGFVPVDSFELDNSIAGEFTAAVEVTLVLTEGVAPGTSIYIYEIIRATGALIPVASSVVGEDGRTIVITLNRQGRYLVLILADQMDPAAQFEVWAFADFALGEAPLEINFFAFESGGIEPITYLWDFGDGGEGEGSVVSHSYLAMGEYNVVLTATDDSGRTAVFDSTSIEITGEPAPLDVVLQSPQPTGNEREMQLIATVSGGFAPFTYEWDFGDGTSSEEPNPIHTYAESGIFAVSVTVTDAFGFTFSPDSQTADVRSAALDGAPLAGQRELDVTFDVYAAADDDNPTVVSLDFGDDSSLFVLSTLTEEDLTIDEQVLHTYLLQGTYTATLLISTMWQSEALEIQDTVQIVVGPGTPEILDVAPNPASSGDLITVTGRFFEDGTNGTLRWSGTDIPTETWSDTEITFLVPASSVDGVVTVVNEGLESIGADLKVIPDIPEWGEGGLGQF